MKDKIVIIGAGCFQNPLILKAKEMGFLSCFSGPLIRSSYSASEQAQEASSFLSKKTERPQS